MPVSFPELWEGLGILEPRKEGKHPCFPGGLGPTWEAPDSVGPALLFFLNLFFPNVLLKSLSCNPRSAFRSSQVIPVFIKSQMKFDQHR